jgi:hypothetical protein
MKKLALVALAVALAGCATNNDWAWDKPGSTQRDFDMDHGQCRAQAFAVPGVSLLQAVLVLDGCMHGKGYTKVPKR